eukprot:TRINITY_DN71222_c0_g1_i1.p1 TRINITY_DN71222_c0_g1~~TRINITY_DN71222_c0_g1_i1.p1  ORF type:complete len:354 (+),score=69.20 TRINITY_DN71222_c0_g1_i1:92-1063(+)
MAGLLAVYVSADGTPHSVEVGADATVADLHAAAAEAVQCAGGPPIGNRRLMFQGEPLADPGQALADAGVCPEAALEVEQREGLYWVSAQYPQVGLILNSDPGLQNIPLGGSYPDDTVCRRPDGALEARCLSGDMWCMTSACLPATGAWSSPVFTIKHYVEMMWVVAATEPPTSDSHFGYRNGTEHEDSDRQTMLLFLNILSDNIWWRGAGCSEVCKQMQRCAVNGASYQVHVTADNEVDIELTVPGEAPQSFGDCPARSSFKQVVSQLADRTKVRFGVAARNAKGGIWLVDHVARPVTPTAAGAEQEASTPGSAAQGDESESE